MQTLNTLVSQVSSDFAARFQHAPDLIAYAPGRINLIGEHTDYNEGLSMPSGINRWVLVAIRKRSDLKVVIDSANFEGEISFEMGETPELDISWKKYVFGIVSVFHETYPLTAGFEAYIFGNVPLAAGVSSSAAIEVATMNALRGLYQAPQSDLEVVKGCQQVEHRFLKIKSGMLDQYASQFSVAHHVLMLDFQKLSHTTIPAELPGWKWVVVNTMVKRELASGSGYSERVQQTSDALAQLQVIFPAIKHMRDIRPEHLDSLTDDVLRARIRHYVTENQRVLEAADALRKGDVVQLGELLNTTHHSLQFDYACSCDEADYLVETARTLPGCAGARMMGGGFGGCTLHLVSESAVPAFSHELQLRYEAHFGIKTEPEVFALVGGAGVWGK